jgi:hypothetical protein
VGLPKRTGPNTLKLDSLISMIGDRDPAIFDGETWLMFCAARPEWDYAWQMRSGTLSLDDLCPVVRFSRLLPRIDSRLRSLEAHTCGITAPPPRHYR